MKLLLGFFVVAAGARFVFVHFATDPCFALFGSAVAIIAFVMLVRSLLERQKRSARSTVAKLLQLDFVADPTPAALGNFSAMPLFAQKKYRVSCFDLLTGQFRGYSIHVLDCRHEEDPLLGTRRRQPIGQTVVLFDEALPGLPDFELVPTVDAYSQLQDVAAMLGISAAATWKELTLAERYQLSCVNPDSTDEYFTASRLQQLEFLRGWFVQARDGRLLLGQFDERCSAPQYGAFLTVACQIRQRFTEAPTTQATVFQPGKTPSAEFGTLASAVPPPAEKRGQQAAQVPMVLGAASVAAAVLVVFLCVRELWAQLWGTQVQLPIALSIGGCGALLVLQGVLLQIVLRTRRFVGLAAGRREWQPLRWLLLTLTVISFLLFPTYFLSKIAEGGAGVILDTGPLLQQPPPYRLHSGRGFARVTEVSRGRYVAVGLGKILMLPGTGLSLTLLFTYLLLFATPRPVRTAMSASVALGEWQNRKTEADIPKQNPPD